MRKHGARHVQEASLEEVADALDLFLPGVGHKGAQPGALLCSGGALSRLGMPYQCRLSHISCMAADMVSKPWHSHGISQQELKALANHSRYHS